MQRAFPALLEQFIWHRSFYGSDALFNLCRHALEGRENLFFKLNRVIRLWKNMRHGFLHGDIKFSLFHRNTPIGTYKKIGLKIFQHRIDIKRGCIINSVDEKFFSQYHFYFSKKK